jgi:hypothetical protein
MVDGWATWLRQAGEMRMAPDRPWFPFEAQEWFAATGIDFRWQAWVRMAPLVTARVVDSDKGEALLRGLSELPWHPLGFLETPSLSGRQSPNAGCKRASTMAEPGYRPSSTSMRFKPAASKYKFGSTRRRPMCSLAYKLGR